MPFEVTMLIAIFVAIVLLSHFTVMAALKGVCNLVAKWWKSRSKRDR